MSFEKYEIILEKISHCAKLISLYNWGEPLLNPDLLSIIEITSEKKIRTHIDTNFATKDFSENELEKLVKSGLSSLFVSLDGASQAAYEKYRVRGRYDRVIRNLTLMAHVKNRLQSPSPFLGWQFHVHRYNECDMQKARKISEDIGVPIVFKRLSTPEFEWKSTYHDNDEMFIGDRAWFWQAYNSPKNPDMDEGTFHPQVPGPCRQLYGTMVIEWNGDVYPCTVVSSPAHVMGNIIHNSLDEVWNGVQFQRSRSFINAFGPPQGGESVCENNLCALTHKCAV